jgi:hypothetical protein
MYVQLLLLLLLLPVPATQTHLVLLLTSAKHPHCCAPLLVDAGTFTDVARAVAATVADVNCCCCCCCIHAPERYRYAVLPAWKLSAVKNAVPSIRVKKKYGETDALQGAMRSTVHAKKLNAVVPTMPSAATAAGK